MTAGGSALVTEIRAATAPPRAQLRIGAWIVDPPADEIRSGNEVVKLEPRSMRLLLHLATHAGEVVGLDQLLEAVWPNVVVTPQSVYNTIAQLRRTLGDSADAPAYIATVARKGYRLIAPVHLEPPIEAARAPDEPASTASGADGAIASGASGVGAAPPGAPPAAARPRWFRRPLFALGLAFGLGIGALVYVGTIRPRAPESNTVPDETVATAGPSIAILPLQDFSEGHDQEYLSDGLAEELTHLLSQIPGLRVASRTSSFAFKGRGDDIAAIAARLHVSHVLEGSVRRAADRIRITLQLIRTDTGFHVWSKTYDRDGAELFHLEDDVAAEVVQKLSGTLLIAHVARSAPNPDAYNLLLQGRYYGRRGTEADRARSIALYESAVSIDPAYALAWAWLAQGYGVQAANGWTQAATGYDRARRAALRAIELDPKLADGHAALGYVLESYDWSWSEAEAEDKRALELDPSSQRVLNLNAHMAMTLGRVAEAERLYGRSIAADPSSPGAHVGLIVALRCQDRLAEAEAEARATIRIAPAALHAALGIILLDQDKPDAALAEVQLEREERWRLSDLPLVYDALGRRAEADRALAELTQKFAQFPYRIAIVHASRGQKDAAFEWLERARQAKDFDMLWLKVDPAMRPLHADPRYASLVHAMGLPP